MTMPAMPMKMAKKKAARDKIMATKTDEKGLIIVNTGKGKGKSTAGFGMIFRHIAHGMPCAVVQFIKGAMGNGRARPDRKAFRRSLPVLYAGRGLYLGDAGSRPRRRHGARRPGRRPRN